MADFEELEKRLRNGERATAGDTYAAYAAIRQLRQERAGALALAKQTVENAENVVASLQQEITQLRQERDKALPWKMFYGDGKTLAEIAEHFGKSVYAFSPWLMAPQAHLVSDLAAARAVIAELKEALLPFAEAANNLDDDFRDVSDIWEHSSAMALTAGDLRRARAALSRLEKETP